MLRQCSACRKLKIWPGDFKTCDECRVIAGKWRAEHPEAIKKSNDKWHKNNPTYQRDIKLYGKQGFRRKVCKLCNKTYVPTGGRQLYCIGCKRPYLLGYDYDRRLRTRNGGNRPYGERRKFVRETKKYLAYGGYYNDKTPRCSCCGVTNLEVLHGHHNGDKDPTHKDSERFYSWIVANNWPADIEVLCCNCHTSKRANNGICKLHGGV